MVVVVLVIVIVVVRTVVNPTAVQPRNQQQPTGLARLVPPPRRASCPEKRGETMTRAFGNLNTSEEILGGFAEQYFFLSLWPMTADIVGHAIVREECVRLPRTLAKIVRRYVDDCVRLAFLLLASSLRRYREEKRGVRGA